MVITIIILSVVSVLLVVALGIVLNWLYDERKYSKELQNDYKDKLAPIRMITTISDKSNIRSTEYIFTPKCTNCESRYSITLYSRYAGHCFIRDFFICDNCNAMYRIDADGVIDTALKPIGVIKPEELDNGAGDDNDG